MPTAVAQPAETFLDRRVLTPLRDLLLTGITPRRLAWSLAIGVVLGINPLLGTATLLTLAAALAFRLNVVATQLANYLVYPLQLVLILVFLRAGSSLFRSDPVPFDRVGLRALAIHPIHAARILAHWELQALAVWLLCAAIAAPLLAAALTPALRRLLASRQQPVA